MNISEFSESYSRKSDCTARENIVFLQSFHCQLQKQKIEQEVDSFIVTVYKKLRGIEFQR